MGGWKRMGCKPVLLASSVRVPLPPQRSGDLLLLVSPHVRKALAGMQEESPSWWVDLMGPVHLGP